MFKLTVLKKAAKFLVRAIVTQKMALWFARQYVSATKTKKDDYSLDLLEAVLDGDEAAAQEAVKKLYKEFFKDAK